MESEIKPTGLASGALLKKIHPVNKGKLHLLPCVRKAIQGFIFTQTPVWRIYTRKHGESPTSMVHKGLTCAYLCQVRLLMVVDLEIYVQMGLRQVVNYASQLFVDVEKQTATITKKPFQRACAKLLPKSLLRWKLTWFNCFQNINWQANVHDSRLFFVYKNSCLFIAHGNYNLSQSHLEHLALGFCSRRQSSY